jgi:transcriptional regulator with XRE-family HTH domain
MNIGPAIKMIRRHLGITQGELSKMTSISQTSLSKIEGGTTPTEKNLKKICHALEVPPSVIYLLGMEDSDVPANKKKMYKLLFPTIKDLALRIVGPDNQKYLLSE